MILVPTSNAMPRDSKTRRTQPCTIYLKAIDQSRVPFNDQNKLEIHEATIDGSFLCLGAVFISLLLCVTYNCQPHHEDICSLLIPHHSSFSWAANWTSEATARRAMAWFSTRQEQPPTTFCSTKIKLVLGLHVACIEWDFFHTSIEACWTNVKTLVVSVESNYFTASCCS